MGGLDLTKLRPGLGAPGQQQHFYPGQGMQQQGWQGLQGPFTPGMQQNAWQQPGMMPGMNAPTYPVMQGGGMMPAMAPGQVNTMGGFYPALGGLGGQGFAPIPSPYKPYKSPTDYMNNNLGNGSEKDFGIARPAGFDQALLQRRATSLGTRAPSGTIPMTCFHCLRSSKHHAAHAGVSGLDLITPWLDPRQACQAISSTISSPPSGGPA